MQKRKKGIFFLDTPGGTGKTFVIQLLLAKDVAVAVASSGIAATLLFSGTTAQSTFKLPFDLVRSAVPSCNITKTSEKGLLLWSCQLIVCDECTMTHKRSLEALNTTLQDVRDCPATMGGITLFLSGDFRQTLPVIPKGTRADVVRAYPKSSPLWKNVTTLSLKTNRRAQLRGDQMASASASDILSIGNGTVPLNEDGELSLTHLYTTVSNSD
ncbi:uncharacterized protein LOC115219672 [Octopus sinensis]|uniref:ATP-dependent DNA helicase n=1 Tax=Octopus sinensis TaxID=2607531 RepID=A0A6P7T4J9_9MOLL|nr:uncharacterized protein LOC115219672 [Octopus sinensis]